MYVYVCVYVRVCVGVCVCACVCKLFVFWTNKICLLTTFVMSRVKKQLTCRIHFTFQNQLAKLDSQMIPEAYNFFWNVTICIDVPTGILTGVENTCELKGSKKGENLDVEKIFVVRYLQ